MNAINQNSAFKILENDLVPKPDLIDSRTELDRLNFLVDFASLVNFYDRTNSIHGDWRPFLLKDPVFLLTAIAKTPYQKLHALYLNTCLSLKEQLQKENKNKTIATLINALYNQFIYVFQLLGQWSLHMLKYTGTYKLKTYIINGISETYSVLLWALLALNKELVLTGQIQGIKAIDTAIFQFDGQKVWKLNKDKEPYWTILQLQYPLTLNSTSEIYEALYRAGNRLFSFLHTVVTSAKQEFESIKKYKSPFPDTVLLRTFTQLLRPYKSKINTLAQKHLDFYYKDVLKQETKGAVADSVYICAVLNTTQLPFDLKAKTLFNAGTYPNSSPVLFESIKPTSLNPAKLPNAYTLIQKKGTSGYTELAFQKITTPGVLKKNESGQTLKWSTFGSQTSKTSKTIKNGIAFASPMLFLGQAKGSRTITLTLNFDGEISNRFLNTFSYALSTKEEWLEVSKKNKRLESSTLSEKVLTLKIVLKPSDAAITPFAKNPDGYSSPWPLFRMLFAEVPSFETPPQIKSFQITVDVKKLKPKVLYNDFGILSSKKPFQPFGPAPKNGQNFIVGSAEIFSKPIHTLEMTINWNGLPEMFGTYYKAYNTYLNPPKKESLLDRIKRLGTDKDKTPDEVFNNTAFKVEFRLLQNGLWKTIGIVNNDNQTDETNTDETKTASSKKTAKEKLNSYLDHQGLLEEDKKNLTPLFNKKLPSPSFFALDQEQIYSLIPDPDLQKKLLKFSSTSTFGFLEMELADPKYGFGSSLYAQVVSAVTLANAEAIVRSIHPIHHKNPKFTNTPNLPFTPVANDLALHYQTDITYDLGTEKNEYPIEAFYYTPFQNYKVYDHETGIATKNSSIGSPAETTSFLPLYASNRFKGQLFLALEALSAPAAVSFYFQLTRTTNTTTLPTSDIQLYYLGESGWKPLTVLEDYTNSFTCSGLITFNIPNDITETNSTMPGQSYWISIGTMDDPSNYPKTAFLEINGLKLQRKLTKKIGDVPLYLPAKSITQPQTAIAQIATIQQPFASFGGIEPENQRQNNLRISTRLGTKDRLVTGQDYFRTVLLTFPQLFYAKTLYDQTTGTTLVLAVEKIKKSTDTNAFSPLIDNCLEQKIQAYLQSRSLISSSISVGNFEHRYLRIVASITIDKNLEPAGTAKKINEGIQIFLSPWIESEQPQIAIDSGVTAAKLASFIKRFDTVVSITAISLELGTKNTATGVISYSKAVQEIQPKNRTVLLVPSMDNSKIVYN